MSSMFDRLNAKKFAIMDREGDVKAGAGFAFHGHIISMSAIYNSPMVVTFNSHGEIVGEHSSVEEAVHFVLNKIN